MTRDMRAKAESSRVAEKAVCLCEGWSQPRRDGGRGDAGGGVDGDGMELAGGKDGSAGIGRYRYQF